MNDAPTPKITIITPVYQAQPFLHACLDSILSQSLKDWELLLIDDGSDDGSIDICASYAADDDRITLLHQDHAGPSAARNTGLDHAAGDFITMVDADDLLLTHDFLQILYNAVRLNDAQISMCRQHVFHDPPTRPAPSSTATTAVTTMSGAELSNSRHIPEGFHYDFLHGKLYLRDLFANVRFPTGHYLEDIAIQHRLIYPCQTIALVDQDLYGYRIRYDSVTRSSPPDRFFQDMVYAFQDRIRYYTEMGESKLAHQAEQSLLNNLHQRRRSTGEKR